MSLRSSPHSLDVLDGFHQRVCRRPKSAVTFHAASICYGNSFNYPCDHCTSFFVAGVLCALHPSIVRLVIANPLFLTSDVVPSRRTASAIAIAITQSSCAPSAADALPSG
jgi:hypothetical protein